MSGVSVRLEVRKWSEVCSGVTNVLSAVACVDEVQLVT